MITAEQIGKLRLETGAGVMACKKALEDSGGDYAKAKILLAQNAQVIAKKKSAREVKKGLIECYCHGGKIGVLLELACETDFVARNDEFKKLAHELALQIASMNPSNAEELMGENYIRDESMTIRQLVEQSIAKIGENIQVKRFVRFELGEE
jgi:elongation factor Ts